MPHRLSWPLPAPFRRFLSDEQGTIIAETVVVLPILIWAYIGLFVYWDTFRSVNSLQKATYTIADMISRERTGITTSYISGAHGVLEYLIDDHDGSSVLRVTSVTYSGASNRFEVHWSRSTNAAAMPELTSDSLQHLAGAIPTMSPGDYVVIVEVQQHFVPAFNVGLSKQTFSQFIVTRPRFNPCLAMDNTTCPVT